MSILGKLAKPNPVASTLTHADLVELAVAWLRTRARRMMVVAPEAQGHSTSEYPDAIGWTAYGSSILIECKTSLADFRRDRDKWFRREPERGMGVLRYFLTPPGLLTGQALPERWGLLEPWRVDGVDKVRVAQNAVAFPAAPAALAEAPLLVRLVRAKAGRWDNHERIWVHLGNRPATVNGQVVFGAPLDAGTVLAHEDDTESKSGDDE